MAGKTLISGTGYEITGGKTLIGGTSYDISFKFDPVKVLNTATTVLRDGWDGDGNEDAQYDAAGFYNPPTTGTYYLIGGNNGAIGISKWKDGVLTNLHGNPWQYRTSGTPFLVVPGSGMGGTPGKTGHMVSISGNEAKIDNFFSGLTKISSEYNCTSNLETISIPAPSVESYIFSFWSDYASIYKYSGGSNGIFTKLYSTTTYGASAMKPYKPGSYIYLSSDGTDYLYSYTGTIYAAKSNM